MSNIDWSQMITAEMKAAQAAAQLLAQVQAELARRRSEANDMVATLQDAVEMGDASPDEEAAYLAWREYRVLLLRVPKQPGYPGTVDWPVAPPV